MGFRMKRISALLLFVAMCAAAGAQTCRWVFLADKEGVEFDAQAYFDAKALERYAQCGADPSDVSNRPLRADYSQAVGALATEVVGESRWLNAMGVMATDEEAERIMALPFVTRVLAIEEGMQLAAAAEEEYDDEQSGLSDKLTDQLLRMGGIWFREAGIDGKGIRIAVFDGGFPRVNTHIAFKHLRDNHQILKTWNFPNKKENVYGWNSHGTMTLSCIGGRIGNKDLGLATGAEYLLARTEVNTEPAKEEVWWQMAVEWADKNGSNIISSSLGYGKERHYTKDMDGTSLVARAANMAARKGMLVVNSAGNEATDGQWRTIITPSDADSALCVGGIEHSLTGYRHISFSSYGPSADGRLKPNVCAFGHALTAAVGSDRSTHYVDGTSFSCPLVAGFAACAWQASPGKSNMELFRMIEQSGDLYPYFDYAFGYGVPQASWFVDKPASAEPTFRLADDLDNIYIIMLQKMEDEYLFYNSQRADGSLDDYGQIFVSSADEGDTLVFAKAGLHKDFSTPLNRLNVHLMGYTATYTPNEAGQQMAPMAYQNSLAAERVSGGSMSTLSLRDRSSNRTKRWGGQSKYRYDVYLQYGLTPNTMDEELTVRYSSAFRFGGRVLTALSKSYCLGVGLEYGKAGYNFSKDRTNDLDNLIWPAGLPLDELAKKKVTLNEWSIELFQRVRFVAGGMLSGRGVYWDLGIYGSKANNRYFLRYDRTDNPAVPYRQEEVRLKYAGPLSAHVFNYGVTTRVGYSIAALYARYRLTGLIGGLNDDQVVLPRLEVGLQLAL